MNGDRTTQESHEPDRLVRKDVSDLQIEFGRIQSDLRHLKENSVTHKEFANWKVEFANWKLDTVKWFVQLSIPLFAVVLGGALGYFLSN